MSEDEALIDFFDEEKPSRVLAPLRLRAGLRERVESGRMGRMLEYAKTSVAIIDPELAEELASAWPDLPTPDLDLEPLSAEQIEDFREMPRRSAKETKKGKRQSPRS